MRDNSQKRIQRNSLVRFLFVFTVALFFTNSSAEVVGQEEAFAGAWQAYAEAVESGRASRILETSEAVAEVAVPVENVRTRISFKIVR